MNTNYLIQWIFDPFETAKEHFDNVYEHILEVKKTKQDEMKVLTEFFVNFEQVEKEYKRKIESMCLHYQKEVKECFNDERMLQFFQILLNNILQKTDSMVQTKDEFENFKIQMEAMNNEFLKNSVKQIKELELKKSIYNQQLSNLKNIYNRYVSNCDKLNKDCFRRGDEINEKIDKLNDAFMDLRSAETYEEKTKTVDRIINFEMDIGKTSAKDVREFLKEQKSGRSSGLNDYAMTKFESKFEQLRVISQGEIKKLIKKLKDKEDKIIESTETKIKSYSVQIKDHFEETNTKMRDYISYMNGVLTYCSGNELAWKEQISSQLQGFMIKTFIERQDEILKKADNIKNNMEPFISRFNDIKEVNSINKSIN